MSAIRAYVMTRFQRVVCVDHPRISAKFVVSHQEARPGDYWVHLHEMTVWDEGKHGGIVFYSDDLTASVKADEVDLGRLPDRLTVELHGLEGEMKRIVLAATEAFHVEGAIER